MATLEEKQARATEACASGFRGRLLARGEARSMIWREGLLPDNAPEFSGLLSYDLLSYGYSLLSDALDILEGGGDEQIARQAFENAASAMEAVVLKGEDNPDRDFHRFVSAAAHHLSRYSARAYSVLYSTVEEANWSISERCLALLMLRDIDQLDSLLESFKDRRPGDDNLLVERLTSLTAAVDRADENEDGPNENLHDIVEVALTDGFVSALAIATLAFERGDPALIEQARDKLQIGMECAGELNHVPHWWCHRLAVFLISDLWKSSFHSQLPQTSPDAAAAQWPELRSLFVASLYKRSRAEIDLWPSQLVAAGRALDLTDNMVVSLPTSAGKTRIAELCILGCLAAGKRVVFVTPLRALSAQTEVTLQRTFSPLGSSVSSLYGSIGLSGVDDNFLRERDIIVATPEKLDFALRNEPTLLDDVGLVILDEGHMIGLGEREVRYEVQIQKLLKRPDADRRRVVCLSAILPAGDKLEDFVGWLTEDSDDGLIQKDWRPTRLRFGELEWRNDHGWLQLSVGDERPFVPRFLEASVPPIGRRTTPFPRDQRELCLATAWRLVADGQSVLIFCPLRRSVEPFADAIVDLHKRGALPSILDVEEEALSTALAIGGEWFSPEHSLLKCLKLGVAIHHGALPTPYRREVEDLLRRGVLKVTISSPTLAQGLNLSATSLIFHGLFRNRKPIEISEFRNVVGRAGRAFVDVEGLVLYPMYDEIEKKKRHWHTLISDKGGKEMESGLLLLIKYLLARMIKKHQPKSRDELIEYVVNAAYWQPPEIEGESDDEAQAHKARWDSYVPMLDTALLGLIGEYEVEEEDIETVLDTVLQSSLWNRRLAGLEENVQVTLKVGLVGRARYMWRNTTAVQRKAYFLAGVGLNTGKLLDAHADALLELLIKANSGILLGESDEAIQSIQEFAEIVLSIEPFVPSVMPDNWRNIICGWLSGQTVLNSVGVADSDTLKFIEDALIYRLPWAMEAVRVRGLAHQQRISDDLTIEDIELGLAAPAVETGSLNISVATLMKAGFSSRTGATKAVEDGAGTFTNLSELRSWLRSETVLALSSTEDWPSAETQELWRNFLVEFETTRRQAWGKETTTVHAAWHDGVGLPSGSPVRVRRIGEGVAILSADFEKLGEVTSPVGEIEEGIVRATVSPDNRKLDLEYLGPGSLTAA